MPTTCPPSLLACPRCAASLEPRAQMFVCKGCRTQFPILEGVPWLFPLPDAALGEWRARFGRALREHEDEQNAAQEALQSDGLSSTTRSRLEHWRDAQADQQGLLAALLKPMLDAKGTGAIETYLALRTRLPSEQGLTTYGANLYRDWVWGDDENALSLELVRDALDERGAPNLLVLGAGGCRLAYDLHLALRAAHTVAVDFNPLLIQAAARLVAGDTVELYEFPLAPRTARDSAVRRALRAPIAVDDRFHLLLADARYPPLQSAAFDVVVTPWFLDVVQDDVGTSLRRINGLLKAGGRWVSFGSLAFAGPDPRVRLGIDELMELAEANGFARPQWREDEIPYLCSPASRHGRRERVITLAADKTSSAAPAERHESLPDWIVGGRTPVPLTASFQRQMTTTRIHGYIMGLIDGRRSLADMAVVLEQQRLLSRNEAEAALRGFLTTMFEESRRSRAL